MSNLETAVRTPIFRASYAHVWVPNMPKGGVRTPEMVAAGTWPEGTSFSLCMLFPKDSADITALKQMAKNAAINKFGEAKAAALMGDPSSTGFKWPLRDGDTKYALDPEKNAAYKGMFFMNSNNKNMSKPWGIVKLENGKAVNIINQRDFYSGCWAVANVNFAAYDKGGGIGVGCYINSICKIKDDQSLGGGSVDAEADFADFAASQPSTSSADSLLG